MQSKPERFDPYASAARVAEVPGLRARRYRASGDTSVPWHEKTRSGTTVFCHSGSVAVQIKKPPFRCILKPGQCYAVPAGVAMTLAAMDGTPGECTVFEYGEAFDALPAEPPSLGYCFDRMEANEALPGAAGSPIGYEDLQPGFSRMDVICSVPGMRLIAQGHGPGQCVPWHSHDHIDDTFFCMKGRIRIATRQPDEVVELAPGDSFTVSAGTAHFVCGTDGQPCEMLTLQGVGNYNYVPR